MKRAFLNAFFALGLTLLAQGCAGIPYQTYDLVDDIAEDQQALNDAYGRALNGQILLNVLRSRDRWPRHYTNVMQITDQPTIQTTGSMRLTPLGLGSPASPLGGSYGELQHQESTRPTYGVQPLDAAAIGRAVLSPTPRRVFENYWESGWPRDVLLLVMAANARRSVLPQNAPGEAGLESADLSADWSDALPNAASALAGVLGRPQEANANGAHDRGRRRGPQIRAVCGEPLALPASDAERKDMLESLDGAPASGVADCRYFQLAHLLADLPRENVRLRPAPRPVCHNSNRINLRSANEGLLTSMADVSAVDGNHLAVALPAPETAEARRAREREAARARQPVAGETPAQRRARETRARRLSVAPTTNYVALQRCAADDNPAIILEVVGARDRNDPKKEPEVLATYLFEMRSLDAMVYAVGETLRGQMTIGPAATGLPILRGPDRTIDINGEIPLVRGPCPAQPCDLTPLFRVVRGPIDRDEDYAAVIVHRGVRYYAGPAIQSFSNGASDISTGDRTASVLTLLTQIFALNNSPGTLASVPARPVID